MKPVAWRRPNREWNCWDFAETLDDELIAEGGWEPLFVTDRHRQPVVGALGGCIDTCVVCTTPITRRGDAGWQHDLGIDRTGGCLYPVPFLEDQ